MAEFNLVINEQERAELLRLLRNSLGETRVEVHRTHTRIPRERQAGGTGKPQSA